MLFRHPRIAMSKIVGDNVQRNPGHNEMRRCRVAQNMKAPVGDARGAARLRHGPGLVAGAPRPSLMGEHQGVARSASRQRLKEPPPFLGENNVAGLAAFTLADKDRSRIRIEVANAKASEFSVAAPREMRRFDKGSEISLRGVDQPPDFVLGEIAQAGRVDFAKWLDRAPGNIRGNLAIAEGLV